MSWSYNVNMYCTHFQSVKHYCTSVAMVVAKCIFGVALGVSRHKVVAWRKGCFSCVMSVPCYFIKWYKCVIMFRVILLPIFLPLIRHLVKLVKLPDRSTQPLSASLNCALHNISPQVATLSLGTTQCAISTSENYALHNLNAQAQPLISKTVQFAPPVKLELCITQSQSYNHNLELPNCITVQSSSLHVFTTLRSGKSQCWSPHPDSLESLNCTILKPS